MYPKGYTELLERQQEHLVAALHMLYHRLIDCELWVGDRLTEYNGHPRVHDLLVALQIIDSTQDSGTSSPNLQEHCSNLECDARATQTVTTNSDQRERRPFPFELGDDADLATGSAWPPAEIDVPTVPTVSNQSVGMEQVSGHVLTTADDAPPQRPELVPQSVVSMPGGGFIQPNSEWMLDEQICESEASAFVASLGALRQPFRFSIDPLKLTTEATFSRRSDIM